MNTDLATFTIASWSVSRSDSYHFVCSRSFLRMGPDHSGKLSASGTQKPHNLQLHARLAQLKCQHHRIHAPPMRVVRIQYP